MANTLACRGLDHLEEKIPALQYPVDKVSHVRQSLWDPLDPPAPLQSPQYFSSGPDPGFASHLATSDGKCPPQSTSKQGLGPRCGWIAAKYRPAVFCMAGYLQPRL